MSDSGHPKFRNDHGVPEICIGVREFECIGVSPPQDHPHIYIDMGGADTTPIPDAPPVTIATFPSIWPITLLLILPVNYPHHQTGARA